MSTNGSTDNYGSLSDLPSAHYSPERSASSGDAQKMGTWEASLDSFFSISKRGSTVKTELWAGVVNFIANSYLMVLIPQILAHGGFDQASSFTGFVVATAVSSTLVGVLGNLPIPAGPGLGCATYFAFTLTKLSPGDADSHQGMGMESASTISLIAALVMLGLAVVNIPTKVFDLVTNSVKDAMPIGLGLLLSLCGLQQIGLVVSTPDTGVGCGDITNPLVLFGLGGTFLMAFLEHKHSQVAFALPIVLITLLAWTTQYAPWPEGLVAAPDIDGSNFNFNSIGSVYDWLPPVAAIYIICLFDIAGIMYSVSKVAGLVDTETSLVPGQYWVFVACAVGCLVSAFLGCSPCIVFGESFAGVLVGGRTGLTALTMGLLFLLALPFAPIVTAVPLFASAPVLIILGVTLTGLLKFLPWDDMMQSLPSFFVIVLMPFLYSIDKAIVAGLLAHCVLCVLDALTHPLQSFNDFKSWVILQCCTVPSTPELAATALLSPGHTPRHRSIYDDYFEQKYPSVRQLKRHMKKHITNEKQLKTLFDQYATDQHLNVETLERLATALGSRLEEEELASVIGALSRGEAGDEVRFGHFRDWWNGPTPPLTPQASYTLPSQFTLERDAARLAALEEIPKLQIDS